MKEQEHHSMEADASEVSEAVAASPSGFTRRSFLMGLGATAAVVAGGGLVACAPQSNAAPSGGDEMCIRDSVSPPRSSRQDARAPRRSGAARQTAGTAFSCPRAAPLPVDLFAGIVQVVGRDAHFLSLIHI